MKFPRSQTEEISINLTPLIDVVFLLLIFFMVSTTFTKETQLQVDLPKASTEKASTSEGLEVVISSDGQYAVNGQPLVNSQAKTLRAALIELSEGNTQVPLRITADAKTAHQSVVTVMDAAAALGFSRLSLTTQESP